jgi:hypothetical protein
MIRTVIRHARALALPALCAALVASPFGAEAHAKRSGTPKTNVTRTVNTRETALDRIRRSVLLIDREASTPEGEERVLARLSSQLRVSPDTLRAEHAAWSLGYGEMAMVYGFARASRKQPMPPEQVVEMRRQGSDWQAIAKDLGVKVDQVAARVRRHEGPKSAPKSPAAGK